MQTQQAALIVNALSVTVNRLTGFGHILDEVTRLDDDSQAMNERLSDENKTVIQRIEAYISSLQSFAAEGSDKELSFNSFDLFNISKSVNEKIQRLEEAQSYFVQMGEPEQVVSVIQAQVRDLTFALAALYSRQA